MSKRLTAGSVAKLKPHESRQEIPDGVCAGLYLVVQPSGTKSWVVRFRSPVERDERGQRKAKKLTLGPVARGDSESKPEIGKPLSLTQARVLASGALDQVSYGKDPTHDRRAEKAKQRSAIHVDTIDATMAEFLIRYRGKKKQGLRESTRLLTASYLGLKPDPDKAGAWVKTGGGVLKRWSGRPLATITKRDVIELLDAFVDSGRGVTANRTLTVLKTFFAWAMKRDILTVSPIEFVDAPAAEKSRDRALNDRELAALWKAAEADGYPFGRLVQMLVLTGARRDELREAPWSEFDLDGASWKLPGVRSKNGREHEVPLSSTALAVLREIRASRQIKGKRELLFTTNGETPFSGLSKAKQRLDDAMLNELRKSDPKATLAPWTLHDLRRSTATGMAELGVEPHIIEATLNHVSGVRRGVAGIYNRARYSDQIRKALELWAAHIEQIAGVAPTDGTVIALRGVR